MNKIVLSFLVLLSVLSGNETNSTVVKKNFKQKSGVYVGLNIGALNFLGSVMIDKDASSTNFNVNTDDRNLLFKVGYARASTNRVEIYVRQANLQSEKSTKLDAVDLDTSTLGIDYQWGIQSYSSDKILPYTRIALGIGKGKANYTTDDMFALELDLGLGFYYHLTSQVDFSAGLYRRTVALISERDTDNKTRFMALNGLEASINYYF